MIQLNGMQPINNAGNQAIPIKSITIQPGQIIFGKVYKVYENGMAEVQVRDVKVYAQIQTELQEGNRYYFLAAKGEDGKLILKVIEQQMQQNGQKNIPVLMEILKGLKLPQTEQAKQLLQFLIDKGLPITKENIGNLLAILNEKPLNESTKQAITTLIEKQLPMTKEVFQSIVAFQQKTTFSEGLGNLINILQKEQPAALNQLNQLLTRSLEGGKNTTTPTHVQLHALKEILNELQHIEEKSNPFLKEQNVSNEEKQRIIGQLVTNLKENQLEIKNMIKEANDPIIGKLFEGGMSVKGDRDGMNTLFQFINKIEESKIPMKQKEAIVQLLLKNIEVLHKESAVITLDSNAIKSAIKEGIASLGIHYEKDLFQQLITKKELTANEQDSLKPFLLKLQETLTTQEGKSIVEQLLGKLTGQQLLAKDVQGPMVFLTTVFPMYIENTLRDIVIQWSGRKKKGETIDAEYCRVVFLLHFENIGETVIDMSVQQRVISLSIYNGDGEVEKQGKVFEEELKNHLEEMNYVLSVVRFLTPKMEMEKKTSLEKVKQLSPTYGGVDYKI